MAKAKRYDALIIGGGHNGLTCACYLAGAGPLRIDERQVLPVRLGAAQRDHE